jgi:hypothetical protein
MSVDLNSEEEESCTYTCPVPTPKHKEKKEDKSLQLKKVFNELAEELKVCTFSPSSIISLYLIYFVVSAPSVWNFLTNQLY